MSYGHTYARIQWREKLAWNINSPFLAIIRRRNLLYYVRCRCLKLLESQIHADAREERNAVSGFGRRGLLSELHIHSCRLL